MKKFMVLVLVFFSMMGSISLAFSPPAANDVQDVRLLAVARDPAGNVWAVWEADTGMDVDLHFSQWQGQAWSATQPVHSRPDAWDRAPSLALAADGTPWLAWASAARTAPDQSKLYVSRWEDGQWTAPEAAPLGSVAEATEPALAAGPDGALWLAWVGFDGVDDEIYASRWDGVSWSAPQQVSADDDDPLLYDRQPRLAVGKDGRPWLVWTGHQTGVDDEIYASRWTGQSWTPEQMISLDDDALDVWPALAVDAQGQPWVAWMGRVTDQEYSRLRILVSHWDASRGAWTAETVASSALALEVDEAYPALAVDGQGQTSLVWLAASVQSTSVAHARWENGKWTQPRIAHDGVKTFGVALVGGQEDLRALWLTFPPARLLVEQAPIKDTARPLEDWANAKPLSPKTPSVDPFPNRYLAFGDSITWGQYGGEYNPYPSLLQDALSLRVTPDSHVVNSGEPGEGAYGGCLRIKNEVNDHRPTYILIMEGTNDVSRRNPPSEVLDHLICQIDEARKSSDVDGVKVMLATIVPRLDDKNDETEEMNEQAIREAVRIKKKVPLCDPWQAFYDNGPPWQDYWDEKHPGQEGLQILADTFYDCILHNYSEINQEAIPPDAWIESLPAQTECGEGTVTWNGSDNMSWVVDYDLQQQVNSGPWTEWLLATPQTSAAYGGHNYGDVVGFQVRGRDLVGNLGSYSAPAYTTITDDGPPDAFMNSLPAVQLAPFPVSWWGSDACAAVVAYNVQYRVGASGNWNNWKTGAPLTTDTFPSSLVSYGQTHYFRAQAQDAAGNWSAWSDLVQTELARFTARGHVYNISHQPIAAAQVDFDPASLLTGSEAGGGFVAYLAEGGDYDLTAARNDLYGPLPTMWDLAVSSNVSGLEFVLPPQDQAVTDGGFEAGNLSAWQASGSAPPTLTTTVHTGLGAVELGNVGQDSHLSQVVDPRVASPLRGGSDLTDPTLSFMVRLETAGPASQLQVGLSNSGVLSLPVTFTLAVDSAAWTHAWFDLSGLVSQSLTLTLSVSDSAALLVDEVSLGSSLRGGYTTYLPIVFKSW